MSHTMKREGVARKWLFCKHSQAPDFDDELLQLINEAVKEQAARIDERGTQHQEREQPVYQGGEA